MDEVLFHSPPIVHATRSLARRHAPRLAVSVAVDSAKPITGDLLRIGRDGRSDSSDQHRRSETYAP
jgi:hypothetical protein